MRGEPAFSARVLAFLGVCTFLAIVRISEIIINTVIVTLSRRVLFKSNSENIVLKMSTVVYDNGSDKDHMWLETSLQVLCLVQVPEDLSGDCDGLALVGSGLAESKFPQP